MTRPPRPSRGAPDVSSPTSVLNEPGLRTLRPLRLTSTPMRSCSARPLLLIDVDGVVSLFGFAHPPPAGLVPTAVEGVPHLISAHAGALLKRLSATFECVWCSGWEERAEEHLPRLLGLPGGWPHLSFAPEPGAQARHWKLGAIESHAGPDRPLAWVDDAFDDELRPMGRRTPRADPAGAHRAGGRVARGARHEAGGLGAAAVSRRSGTSGGRRSRSGRPAVPMPAETYMCRPRSTTWPAR